MSDPIALLVMRHVFYRSNYRWIDALESVTDAYNKAKHRSLGTTPEEAVGRDEDELRYEQYRLKHPVEKEKKIKNEVTPASDGEKKKRKKRVRRFKAGDVVRVSYLTSTFSREYDENFSHELFRIKRAFTREGLPVYLLEDWDGEAIDGTFYQHELSLAYPPRDDVFKIEKVLKRKGRGANARAYVKFYGWPKKFNAWVPAADVVDIVQE